MVFYTLFQFLQFTYTVVVALAYRVPVLRRIGLVQVIAEVQGTTQLLQNFHNDTFVLYDNAATVLGENLPWWVLREL